jgi:hypothetical protein
MKPFVVFVSGPSDPDHPDAGAGVRGGVPDGTEGSVPELRQAGAHAVVLGAPDQGGQVGLAVPRSAGQQPHAIALGQRSGVAGRVGPLGGQRAPSHCVYRGHVIFTEKHE